MEALVTYAERVYKAPGVESGLLTLQDRYGLDVCVILACAWYGAAGGGRLDSRQVEALEDVLAKWRVQVVQPLRGVRRTLKGELGEGEAAQALRDRVKACELDAERIELERLEHRLGRFPVSEADEEARARDAAANILMYLREGEAPVDDASRETLLTLLNAMFPGLDEARARETIEAVV